MIAAEDQQMEARLCLHSPFLYAHGLRSPMQVSTVGFKMDSYYLAPLSFISRGETTEISGFSKSPADILRFSPASCQWAWVRAKQRGDVRFVCQKNANLLSESTRAQVSASRALDASHIISDRDRILRW